MQKITSDMGSVGLVYDDEGEILDADFRLTGEKPRQGICRPSACKAQGETNHLLRRRLKHRALAVC